MLIHELKKNTAFYRCNYKNIKAETIFPLLIQEEGKCLLIFYYSA
ncbi:hypothetical protein ECDEC10B_4574 [Escherichia coli DEC10B]|nr:hypothetical protein ECDEC8A_3807 [Escherichia coli DEC8A]EHW65566.1 hypothetical protein ECDEC10B_4574 [Escherichia coli DEC10B]EHW87092.1 hypothetical protein ECDEC10E_3688 [Escherichia coli DEC10E]